jgi:PE family
MSLIGDISRGVSEAFRQVNEANKNVASGTFTVNQHNVLAAARIIETQADALTQIWKNARRDMNISPPGSDDVSTRIAPAWNDRLISDADSYANRVGEYITGLKKLAVQLGDSAKAYGYTEDQIEAAFRGE